MHTPEAHTSDNIRSSVATMFEEWGLEESQQTAVTTDNAANMEKACRDAGM